MTAQHPQPRNVSGGSLTFTPDIQTVFHRHAVPKSKNRYSFAGASLLVFVHVCGIALVFKGVTIAATGDIHDRGLSSMLVFDIRHSAIDADEQAMSASLIDPQTAIALSQIALSQGEEPKDINDLLERIALNAPAGSFAATNTTLAAPPIAPPDIKKIEPKPPTPNLVRNGRLASIEPLGIAQRQPTGAAAPVGNEVMTVAALVLPPDEASTRGAMPSEQLKTKSASVTRGHAQAEKSDKQRRRTSSKSAGKTFAGLPLAPLNLVWAKDLYSWQR